jgi:hypothetical protein
VETRTDAPANRSAGNGVDCFPPVTSPRAPPASAATFLLASPAASRCALLPQLRHRLPLPGDAPAIRSSSPLTAPFPVAAAVLLYLLLAAVAVS